MKAQAGGWRRACGPPGGRMCAHSAHKVVVEKVALAACAGLVGHQADRVDDVGQRHQVVVGHQLPGAAARRAPRVAAPPQPRHLQQLAGPALWRIRQPAHKRPLVGGDAGGRAAGGVHQRHQLAKPGDAVLPPAGWVGVGAEDGTQHTGGSGRPCASWLGGSVAHRQPATAAAQQQPSQPASQPAAAQPPDPASAGPLLIPPAHLTATKWKTGCFCQQGSARSVMPVTGRPTYRV